MGGETMNLLGIIQAWIGTPPAGYEALEYIFAGVFFIMLFKSIIDIFRLIRRTI